MKYRVKNWASFQHYRDRNPPWIKLHFSLLSSQDWVCLSDSERVLAVVCMLIASRNDNQIDGSEAGLLYLQRVGYLTKKPNLKPLVDCGFLEPADGNIADASGSKRMLAEFRPETETQNLKQTETPTAPDATRPPPKVNGHRISFDPLKGAFQGITDEDELRWQEAYPAVIVPQEILAAAAWLKANPANRKSNNERFLVNWFKREQDKAPRVKR